MNHVIDTMKCVQRPSGIYEVVDVVGKKIVKGKGNHANCCECNRDFHIDLDREICDCEEPHETITIGGMMCRECGAAAKAKYEARKLKEQQ